MTAVRRNDPVKVVVLGGGYAGLSFVRGLGREGIRDLEMTLVDRNAYHTLMTETHTVAAGTGPEARVKIPLSVMGAGVRLIQSSVLSIDTERRWVRTQATTIPYDYLAFCLGGRDNDFGTPGVREHAFFLRGEQDGVAIRRSIESLADGGAVVVIGGGLTGVELGAEAALHWGRRRTVSVVEAADDLLPGLPSGLRDRARRRLGWLGVNVLTGSRVTGIEDGRVHLADGSILSCGLTVWAAGVAGHPMVREMGADVDRNGRAIVDGRLRSSIDGVYILGDSAAFGTPPLPPSAQLAGQMGFAAAEDLAAELRGETGRPFTPRLRGVLCDLGGLNAVGLVYRFQVQGLFAAVAKRVSVLSHIWRTTGCRGLLHYLWPPRPLTATDSGEDRSDEPLP